MVHSLFLTCLLLGLVAVSRVDIRTLRIPDLISIPLIFLGLLYSFLIEHDVQASFLGAMVGYGFFYAVEKAFLVVRGYPGLGRGDAKLLAAGGAWCGVAALPAIILIASGTGLIAAIVQILLNSEKSDQNFQLPFGPFLAIGIACMTFANLGFFDPTH